MLTGKVVVVTGGAGLLGREFCRAIARAGGTAVVADVDAAAAGAAAEAIRADGGSARSAALDITSRGSVDAAIDSIVAEHGRVDAVVNNAYPRNARYGRKLEDVEFPDFCENVSVHLGGYFLVAQRFAIHFASHGGGNIVNMASVYGVVAPRFGIYANTPMTMPVEYAAIKSGVLHLTRYFAQYFKGRGIRCNAISPGGILAGQPEEFVAAYRAHCADKGMLDADDVSGALVFLLSDESRFVTGQNIVVDDGFSL